MDNDLKEDLRAPATVLNALRRGMVRNLLIFALAMVFYYLPETFPEFFGPVWAPWVRKFGLLMTVVNAIDIVMRVWQPYVDNKELNQLARTTPTSAAIMYGARMIFAGLIFLGWSLTANATTTPPANAVANAPLLRAEMKAHWPNQHLLSLNGAQIEQETCVRLTHPQCWTSRAQLTINSKHGLEKGRGFGQLTAVWRPDGTKRFDNLGDMRLKYPRELGNYGWDNWDDPVLSMRAYVLFMRDTCRAVPNTVTDEKARFQMCLSAYNGGRAGLLNDILSCRATKGCIPTIWENNVELTSNKSRVRVAGYGQAAFDINRGYVKNVSVDRRVRYMWLDPQA